MHSHSTNMAAVLDSVPETLYESLWDAVETVDNTAAPPPPRTTAAPVATLAIDWLFVVRIFAVCTLLLLAVRQLRRRRHRKAL